MCVFVWLGGGGTWGSMHTCVYTCMCVHIHVRACVHVCESHNIINSQYNNTRECIDCFWRLKVLYNLENMQRANAIHIYIYQIS